MPLRTSFSALTQQFLLPGAQPLPQSAVIARNLRVILHHLLLEAVISSFDSSSKTGGVKIVFSNEIEFNKIVQSPFNRKYCCLFSLYQTDPREQFTFFLAIYFIFSDLMFSFILEACYTFTGKSGSDLNGGVLKKCRKSLKASLFVGLSLSSKGWSLGG